MTPAGSIALRVPVHEHHFICTSKASKVLQAVIMTPAGSIALRVPVHERHFICTSKASKVLQAVIMTPAGSIALRVPVHERHFIVVEHVFGEHALAQDSVLEAPRPRRSKAAAPR